MGNDINIMVLCNNEMAIPAMQQLHLSGSLKAVVVPEKNAGLFSLLKQMLTGTGISLVSVNKKTLESTIKKIIAEKKLTAAWLMTFSYMIPKSLLTQIPGGFVNFHYGLLPQYRGPNPVLAQMLNGETESGITIHIVDENMDTGPVVLQQKINIEDGDTFGMQLQKLGELGASLVQPMLQFYQLSPLLPSGPQDESMAGYYKNPVADDLMIKWNSMNSQQIIRLINACNPWNKGAGAVINNRVICLTVAELSDVDIKENKVPGTIVGLDDNTGLLIYCLDNKGIKINMIYTPEGFFTGLKLLDFGIQINDRFVS